MDAIANCTVPEQARNETARTWILKVRGKSATLAPGYALTIKDLALACELGKYP